MATVFFVDTNFFLQLKEPESLPWSDISGEAELLLMVPRTVQMELDRLKQDGNSRRSKRARKASSFLRSIVQSPDATILIREAAPRVRIGFPPLQSASTERPATLDAARPDDQIVAEVLNFKSCYPEDDVSLLTSDTGPMLTARHHGLPFVAIPETWLLGPEPDERDKTIQELKRRLDSLERTHPRIDTRAVVEGREIERIEKTVPMFEPLSDTVIEQLMTEVLNRCPRANEFGLSGTELTLRRTVALAKGGYVKYTAPTADEISKYCENEYPAWLTRVRQTIADAASRLNAHTQPVRMRFRVANIGTVPANNAILEIRAHGELSIRAPQKEHEEKQPRPLRLPMPPTPPLGHVEEKASIASPYNFFDRHYDSVRAMAPPFRQVPPERDRYAFYWDVKSSAPTNYLSFTCDEFRHQTDEEDFELEIVLPQGRAISGAISCRFSATNLPEPVQLTIPVTTLPTITETEECVRSLIQGLPRRVLAGPVEIVDPET